MDTGQLLTILDLSGVWAFAVSGSLTAMQKRMGRAALSTERSSS